MLLSELVTSLQFYRSTASTSKKNKLNAFYQMNNRIVNVVMKHTERHKYKWAHATQMHRHAKLLVILLFWVNNMQIVLSFMAGTVIVCLCVCTLVRKRREEDVWQH